MFLIGKAALFRPAPFLRALLSTGMLHTTSIQCRVQKRSMDVLAFISA